jgi:DNA-binding transcriptional LysR family regulator
VSEVRHAPINIQIALPSLEAIKRAVELQMGVALLPRRCALTEIARGTLVAVRVPEVRLPRQVRLVYRRRGELSHAATAFLEMVRQMSTQTDRTETPAEQMSRPTLKRSVARAASAFQPS